MVVAVEYPFALSVEGYWAFLTEKNGELRKGEKRGSLDKSGTFKNIDCE